METRLKKSVRIKALLLALVFSLSIVLPVAATAAELYDAYGPANDVEITTPANDAPVNEAPANEAPVNEEPANEAPVNEAPANEAPVNEEPANEAPVNEEPANEAPVNEAPANEAPANGGATKPADGKVDAVVEAAAEAVAAGAEIAPLVEDDYTVEVLGASIRLSLFDQGADNWATPMTGAPATSNNNIAAGQPIGIRHTASLDTSEAGDLNVAIVTQVTGPDGTVELLHSQWPNPNAWGIDLAAGGTNNLIGGPNQPFGSNPDIPGLDVKFIAANPGIYTITYRLVEYVSSVTPFDQKRVLATSSIVVRVDMVTLNINWVGVPGATDTTVDIALPALVWEDDLPVRTDGSTLELELLNTEIDNIFLLDGTESDGYAITVTNVFTNGVWTITITRSPVGEYPQLIALFYKWCDEVPERIGYAEFGDWTYDRDPLLTDVKPFPAEIQAQVDGWEIFHVEIEQCAIDYNWYVAIVFVPEALMPTVSVTAFIDWCTGIEPNLEGACCNSSDENAPIWVENAFTFGENISLARAVELIAEIGGFTGEGFGAPMFKLFNADGTETRFPGAAYLTWDQVSDTSLADLEDWGIAPLSCTAEPLELEYTISFVVFFPMLDEDVEIPEIPDPADPVTRRPAEGPKTGDYATANAFAQLAALALIIVTIAGTALIRTREQS